MNPESYLGPFHLSLGLEIDEVSEGISAVRLPLIQEHSSMDDQLVAQGGVVFTLADFCGGLAVLSAAPSFVASPTIDMRIDYLQPATRDLRAVGTAVRVGNQTGVADVEVHDEESNHIAQARGVYKLQSPGTDSPWTGE